MVRYTANGTASEDDEEHVLSDYCDVRGWRHTHFSNEMYTTSWKQKHKMKYLGVEAGLPDHFIILKRKTGEFIPVYIEMKRKKGGSLSDAQHVWIQTLRLADQYVTVCEGGEEAIEFLEAVEKNDEKIIQKYFEKFDKKHEKWLKNQEKQKNDCPF